MSGAMNARIWRWIALPVMLSLVAAHPVPPRQLRGRDNADCRANEPGPAVRIAVEGLRDRTGSLRAELYPANDTDFLSPDKVLIAAGKVFKRVDMRVPATGTPVICIRAPRPGSYAISLLHDRDGNGKLGVMRDGVGIPGNSRLGRRRPTAAAATVRIGTGVAEQRVTMQYLRGLGFAPIR